MTEMMSGVDNTDDPAPPTDRDGLDEQLIDQLVDRAKAACVDRAENRPPGRCGDDGLRRAVGLPEAIASVWPATVTQTCVVHLLRNSFRYAGWQHWDAIAKALRPVYTAATEAAAAERFAEFVERCLLLHAVGSDGEDELAKEVTAVE